MSALAFHTQSFHIAIHAAVITVITLALFLYFSR